MTYFGILAVFILPPLAILLAFVPRDLWQWLFRRRGAPNWEANGVVLAHVLIALVYTTPWDNYLVAQGVWWYDPELVTGITFGWVPLEEYTFFVLQTLMTGLWTLGLMRYVVHTAVSFTPRRGLRIGASAVLILFWLVSAGILAAGWQPGRYLALILVWALFPVLIQFIFGADILWANRRLLAAAILPVTVYLWVVDAIAIGSGTWIIDPAQTTGISLGPLPIEEMVFFLMTNVIIAFGIILMLSPLSKTRLQGWLDRYDLRRFNTWGVLQILTLCLWIAVLIATPIVGWVLGEACFAAMATLGVLAHSFATLTALASGWSLGRILRMAAIVLAATWIVEIVGSRTGFPFGAYAYADALGFQLGGVPLVIPLAWLMMLPPAWAVAEMILGPVRARLERWYWPVFALLAGMAFTAWDLYLDPQMAARGLWVWEQPGAYFGIPWTNYLGWWVAATVLTWLVRPGELPRLPLMVIYTLTWAFQAVGLGLFWGQPGPALVGFVGMGVFVSWAWIRERRLWKFSSGPRWVFSAVRSRSH
jgi:putative membrane protein